MLPHDIPVTIDLPRTRRRVDFESKPSVQLKTNIKPNILLTVVNNCHVDCHVVRVNCQTNVNSSVIRLFFPSCLWVIMLNLKSFLKIKVDVIIF